VAILVESPLDVVRFASIYDSPQAVASFGAHVSDVQLDILTSIADRVVVAMDNDEAGHMANQSIYKRIPTPRRGILWWNYKNTKAKDIGDMTDDEIVDGFETATVVPPWVTGV
jgi:DNA primase